MKNILVTGATGFIGRTLCQALKAQGLCVTAVARQAVAGPWDHFVGHDFASGDAFPASALAGIDAIYHLASKAHAVSELPGDDSGYSPIIVEGTRHLLQAAEAAGVHTFIYMSSVKAMGDAGFRQPQKEPIKAEGIKAEGFAIRHSPSAIKRHRRLTPYGMAKAEAEQLILSSKLPHVVVLRPTMVYGSGQKGNLDRMAEAIRKKRFPAIAENGNQRSIVHVDNVIRACTVVAQTHQTHGKVYILAESPPLSTRQIYDRLRSELGMSPTRLAIPPSLLIALAKVGDLFGKLTRKRMPLDSDSVWKLLGSAWYDGSAIERDTEFRYQTDMPLIRHTRLSDNEG